MTALLVEEVDDRVVLLRAAERVRLTESAQACCCATRWLAANGRKTGQGFSSWEAS